jgi:hypothetical protein
MNIKQVLPNLMNLIKVHNLLKNVLIDSKSHESY